MPSNIKAELPAAGNFSLKQRVSTSTSEFYPQSLREKTMPTGYPQITTVYVNEQSKEAIYRPKIKWYK